VGMGVFAAVAEPGERLDPAVVGQVAQAAAGYVDSDRQAPLHDALADLLAEPMAADQLLNSVLGFADVVALLGITLGRDEAGADELVRGILGRSAGESTSGVFEGLSDPLHATAQALICRAYGTSGAEAVPRTLDGRVLVALAAYGDAAVVLADRLGIPRSVLGPALVAAAADMSSGDTRRAEA